MQLHKIVQTAGVLAVLWVIPGSIQAQTPLGAGTERPLSVTASTYAGYDTDLATRGGSPSGAGTGVDTGASHTGVSLSMSYGGGSPKVNYYTMATSEYRHYRASETIKAPLFAGGAGISLSLTRRLRANASLQGNYFPRFQFSVLPTTTNVPLDEPPPTVDYGISSYDVASYQAYSGLSFQLDSRSGLHVTYGRGQFKYLGRDYEMTTQTVGGGYSRNLSRYSTLLLGYTQQNGDYVTDFGPRRQTVQRRTIDAGIRYSRPLSLSRRTTVGFSTGSTVLDNGDRTLYTLNGSANLNHQLSRTWHLGAAYTRRVGLVDGFTEPVFSDSITGRIGGLLGDRVSISASAGYTNGQVGFAEAASNYDSLQASSNVTVPITRRRLSLFGTYFYYRHLFGQSVSLPLGLDRNVSRHGVRGGLMLKVY